MSEIEEKTPRYVFSGKTEDYLTWSKKYMARATMKKFAGVIKGTKKLRTKSEIENETDEGKKKEDKEIEEMNLKGFNDLMLSIDTDSPEGLEAFDIVTECEDANYPDGNLFDAWQKLKTNSEPTTVCAFVDLKNDFNARGLREKEKPLLWIKHFSRPDRTRPVTRDILGYPFLP